MPSGAGLRGGESSIWSRDFGLFFGARAVAKLGDTMLPVALAAGLLRHGHGAGAVGLAMAATTVCFAGLVIFGGVFADRFSTRLLMIGADLVRLGAQALAAVIFFTGHVVLWQICAIGAVNGAAAALFQPGVASTVPRLAADVQKANGAIRVAESTASLAGPAAAGVLVGLASPGAVFAAHAATYGVSALCLLLLRLPPPRAGSQPHSEGFRADLVQGWREFRARTWLWGVIAVYSVLMITTIGPTVPLVATLVVQDHGSGAYGLVNSALGAGTVIGGLIALRLRPRRMLRAGSFALVANCAFPVSVGAGLDVPLMAAGAAVAGAGASFWGVMWATSVQTQVPPDVLNRIHAYDVAGSLAMLPVGQALAGPAASAFGAEAVLITGGAMTVVVVLALLSVPAIRGLVRADAHTGPPATSGQGKAPGPGPASGHGSERGPVARPRAHTRTSDLKRD
ncbi:MFS transporter [Streptomyces alfalfae]|nr:MFS transporter [Streptomyces alfalfae]AYA20947.1 MFS transporter [Streptomyces fradiae]RXX43927.1 MFS transporter [Streptomyces alfalfae]RZM88070.1 MFS transporter [Streptomyces alfalfae]